MKIGMIGNFSIGWVLAGLMSTVSAAEDSGQTGKQLYESYCGSCHQMDGGGVPMMQPELIAIERAAGPVGGVVEMILKGSAAIEPGMSDYGNEMPSFAYLPDDEIALIATYVRTNFENSGGPVTAAGVKKQR